MRQIIIIIFVFISNSLFALTFDTTETQVIKVIQQLFEGMRLADSSMVKPLFEPEATLGTIIEGRNGETIFKNGEKATSFITAIGKPRKDIWDEQILSYDIKIDDRFAAVWTPYQFYLNGVLQHCGVNHFELIQKNGKWTIFSINDTRRKKPCEESPTAAINGLMNAWHKAAAVADEDTFFGSMTPDAYYIGTDASERWVRDEMKIWSKKFFDRDTAWAFTSLKRDIYFTKDGNTAWFDETLDTWMGICRGSGVVVRTKDGWKINQFVLSICVSNNDVNKYLDIINKPRKK